MRYTTFGSKSGLRVSELGLGTSNFGTKWATGTDKAGSLAILDRFGKAGGTFIDTADTYQQGDSELYLADFLANDRDHFGVASKFTFGTAGQTGVGKTGNSRKAMKQSLEATLRRLSTDFLDLYWVHSPDFVTPIDEVVEGLDDLVRAGKILYGGLSNFPAWQVAEAVTASRAFGRNPIIGTQFEYSLAARDGERDLIPMAESLGLGAALYSPLGGGLLTGKYRLSPEGRLTTLNSIIQREDTQLKTAVVDTLLALSAETGLEPAVLAIAWLRARNVRSATALVAIVGPRTLAQLDSYLAALEVELEDEHYRRLDEASRPVLGIPHDSGIETRNAVLGGIAAGFVLPAGPRAVPAARADEGAHGA
ncbi:aldo/keto reductase [Gryllotalpicola protaetiae]|uniref:Aldo/keto reductase n=1 Tax=Gryllotalpicola protaetiae TaxID=2419771 RepID=A0A387BSB1_9MICO|nr:aldo/keto reductase [Gryllotalpicola protaetiae]AYG03896.1 aldo/keto reductase [Gryllotalpicola protaetiae]